MDRTIPNSFKIIVDLIINRSCWNGFKLINYHFSVRCIKRPIGLVQTRLGTQRINVRGNDLLCFPKPIREICLPSYAPPRFAKIELPNRCFFQINDFQTPVAKDHIDNPREPIRRRFSYFPEGDLLA